MSHFLTVKSGADRGMVECTEPETSPCRWYCPCDQCLEYGWSRSENDPLHCSSMCLEYADEDDDEGVEVLCGRDLVQSSCSVAEVVQIHYVEELLPDGVLPREGRHEISLRWLGAGDGHELTYIEGSDGA